MTLQLIHHHVHRWDETLVRIPLAIDRLTLEKRRWRATAADGTEFGFDLDHTLSDGNVFFVNEQSYYQIEQKQERVIHIALHKAADGAKIGWMIGNLHFKIGLTHDAIQAPYNPAVLQLLEREGIAFQETTAVFHPLSGGHAHGHAAAH